MNSPSRCEVVKCEQRIQRVIDKPRYVEIETQLAASSRDEMTSQRSCDVTPAGTRLTSRHSDSNDTQSALQQNTTT